VAALDLIDFRVIPPGERKTRIELGDDPADGRAFFRRHDTRIYWFGCVAYRETSSRVLEEQFRNERAAAMKPANQFGDRAGGDDAGQTPNT
jgi:hypothetical protein